MRAKWNHRLLATWLACFLVVTLVAPSAAQGSLSPEKTLALQLADQNRALIERVARTIWETPEIGLNEYRSSGFLSGELEKAGFTVERGVAQFPTAFTATYTKGTGGPVIGLLAEYDALPSLSTVTPGGPGHGCGHNLYGAGAFGTAIVLKGVMDSRNIPGTIKVFGTPAEENFDGKAWMGRQGALKGVDVFFGCHASDSNTVPFGSNLAMDFRVYTFYGVSSHAGAAPEKGISALDAVEIMDVAVNFLREHVPSDVRLHYIIRDGGLAPNVVPSRAQAEWFIRAPERGMVDEVVARVDNCAKAGALATGCTGDIELASALHNKIPNRAGTLLAWENYQALGAPVFDARDQADAAKFGSKKGLATEIVAPPDTPDLSKGSSDEGDVSWNAPLINFSAANYAIGTAGHSLELAKQANMPAAFKAMLHNVKLMAMTAIDLLTKSDELARVKDEFAETMKTRHYNPGETVMLNLKYFPEPPGIAPVAPDTLSFRGDDTTFDESSGMAVNVYNGQVKVGSLVLGGPLKTYSIKIQGGFKAGDILTVKYQARSKFEIVYGYVKKF